jgi:uncharacterized protein YyaL (SSP411 family)
MEEYRQTYLPNKVLVVLSEGVNLQEASNVVPFVQGKFAMKGKTTAYVCEKGICDLPTTDHHIFAQQITAIETLGE